MLPAWHLHSAACCPELIPFSPRSRDVAARGAQLLGLPGCILQWHAQARDREVMPPLHLHASPVPTPSSESWCRLGKGLPCSNACVCTLILA